MISPLKEMIQQAFDLLNPGKRGDFHRPAFSSINDPFIKKWARAFAHETKCSTFRPDIGRIRLSRSRAAAPPPLGVGSGARLLFGSGLPVLCRSTLCRIAKRVPLNFPLGET
jgi:hypothetical protein